MIHRSLKRILILATLMAKKGKWAKRIRPCNLGAVGASAESTMDKRSGCCVFRYC